MPDIFSRSVEYGGAFSADGAKIMFTDAANVAQTEAGFMSQKLTWQYGQQITRLHELESPRVYLFAGRTQGKLSLDTILGAQRLAVAFYRKFGDACQTKDNTLQFSATVGCGTTGVGSSAIIKMEHCVIEQMGGAVAAENMIVQSTISMQFIKMTMIDGTSPATRTVSRRAAGGGPEMRFGVNDDAPPALPF